MQNRNDPLENLISDDEKFDNIDILDSSVYNLHILGTLFGLILNSSSGDDDNIILFSEFLFMRSLLNDLNKLFIDVYYKYT
jgi:hypothetical protein